MGLTEKDVDDVTEHLADALEARARAMGLYDVESRQVYLESIANANAELGRVNPAAGDAESAADHPSYVL